MKKNFTLILFLFFAADAFASTNASRFAEEWYVSECKSEKVHIVVKKEHTSDYYQKIGKDTIKAITYGYGDMKIKGCRNFRISYICLIDEIGNPVWSYIIPVK